MNRKYIFICILISVLTLTSCIYEWFNYYTVTGTVVGDIDGDGINEPVQGMCIVSGPVSSVNGDMTFDGMEVISDENGEFSFIWKTIGNPKYGYNLGKVVLTIEDIDGNENGTFNSKTVEADFSKYNHANDASPVIGLGEIILSK